MGTRKLIEFTCDHCQAKERKNTNKLDDYPRGWKPINTLTLAPARNSKINLSLNGEKLACSPECFDEWGNAAFDTELSRIKRELFKK